MIPGALEYAAESAYKNHPPVTNTISLSPAALHERLAAVSTDVASPDAVRAALASGRACALDDPAGLLLDVTERAWVSPPLGAAMALGAVEAADETADPLARIYAQAALGVALVRWGNLAHALDMLREVRPALLAAAAPGVSHLIVHWHEVLCTYLVLSPDSAVDTLLSIAGELEAAGEPTLAQRCRLDTSVFWSKQVRDRHPGLVEAIRTALTGQNRPVDEGYATLSVAADAAQQGDYRRAFHLLGRAEALFQQAGAHAFLSLAWQQRGAFYRQHLDIQQALHWLEKAERLATAMQHPTYRIMALVEMAILQFERGDMDRHFAVIHELEQLEPQMHLPALTAFCQLTRANHLLRQASYDAAREAYLAARTQYLMLGNHRFATTCTINLGILARRQGKFSLSLSYLREGLQHARDTGSFEEELGAYRNLAMTYAAFGYIEPAIVYLEQSMELAQARGVTIQSARQAVYLAMLLASHGEGQRARDLLNMVCSQVRFRGIDHVIALCDAVEGEILLSEGHYHEALARFDTARTRFDALGMEEWGWFMQVKIGEAYVRSEDIDRAEEVQQQIPVERLTATFQWHHRSLLARIAEERGQLTDALAAYIGSLLQVHTSRRFLEEEQQAHRFVLSYQTLYDHAFELALDLDDPAEALLIAELHGAQLLATRLGLRDSGIDPRAVPALLRRALGEHLGTDWTVLRYAYHNGKYCLFMLYPEGFAAIRLHLDARARMVLRLAATPGESFRRKAYQGSEQGSVIGPEGRRRLFEALLPPPTRKYLHPDHTLIVVPTGPLHGLAFHALLDGDAPLITRTRVLYAPSLELLYHLLARSAESTGGLGEGLVLAQSSFEQAGYAGLPYVEQEAAAVLGGARGARVPLAELDPDRLSELGQSGGLARYDWLHFATHAYAEPVTGTFTGLLVGRGVLDVQAIRRWRLTARLVTLSACQTGVGRWHYGDEIAGLTQAFISAGAQSVVASLWLVQDESTATLMAAFYRALGEGQSPAAALATAQRAAHRAGVDAYHWAAFSAFGRP